MDLRLTALTTSIIFFVASGTVYAGGHTVDKFLQADTDNNKLVSKTEFMKKYEDKFSKIDANKDGNASGEEYESYINSKYAEKQLEKFRQMDTNKDGVISEEEMLAGAKSWKHKH